MAIRRRLFALVLALFAAGALVFIFLPRPREIQPPTVALYVPPPIPVSIVVPRVFVSVPPQEQPAPRQPVVQIEVPRYSADLTPLRVDIPVQLSQRWIGPERVGLLRGGMPVSRHVQWRSSVVEFIRVSGAAAGVNGTFFKDAAIASNDSNMLGPMLTQGGRFLGESDPALLKKIGGRPLVAWSHDTFLATDFVPATMNHKAQVQAMLPGVTDAFVAGSWLVRGGHALTLRQMSLHAPRDAQEVRPRVFFGVTSGGLVIAGATITPVSSFRLAQIAEQAGAQEAVLLDSGYSTSLIYGSKVVAVGHSTRKTPSRPVPHAIVFMNPVAALAGPGQR